MTDKPWKPHEVAIFATIGLGVGFTPALAIIHEVGHAVVAVLSSNLHNVKVHWASIGSTGDPSQLVFAASYAAMVAFYLTMAGVAIRQYERAKQRYEMDRTLQFLRRMNRQKPDGGSSGLMREPA